jgi:peroxiredoxin
MYQKFHDTGLEVVGIPFDADEAALRAFIKKENIPWPQAFDGKGWNSDVAVKYGMYTIPLHFILGRDGKVADYQFLDSSELEAKVAELLK